MSNLNIAICPGCGERIDPAESECSAGCRYESDGGFPTLRQFLDADARFEIDQPMPANHGWNTVDLPRYTRAVAAALADHATGRKWIDWPDAPGWWWWYRPNDCGGGRPDSMVRVNADDYDELAVLDAEGWCVRREWCRRDGDRFCLAEPPPYPKGGA